MINFNWKAERKRIDAWKKNPALQGLSGRAKSFLASVSDGSVFSGEFDRDTAIGFFSKPVRELLKYRGLGNKTLIEISSWLNLPEPDFENSYQGWMRRLSVRTKNCLLNAGLESEIMAKEALLNGRMAKFRNVGEITIKELRAYFNSPSCKCPQCGHQFKI